VGESCKTIIKIATTARTPHIVIRRGPDRFPNARIASGLIGNPPIESGEGDRAARQSEGTVSWLPHREQRTEPLGFSSKHSEQTRIVLTK
jgi:hypothetical protein